MAGPQGAAGPLGLLTAIHGSVIDVRFPGFRPERCRQSAGASGAEASAMRDAVRLVSCTEYRGRRKLH
jgi:hypothetical protein